MALAILTWQDTDDDYIHFDIDIGSTNRYYQYQIGDDDLRRTNGLKRLAQPNFTSPLMGPLPEESLGRGSLKIPIDKLDRTYHHVQLFSFRTPQLEGPALSEIVEVPVGNLSQGYAAPLELEDEMPFDAEQPVDVVAFAYKEAAPIDSSVAIAMAPAWLNKVGNLAKKATAVVTNPQAQQALKQAGNFLTNPNKQQMLMNAGSSLLSGLGGQATPLNTEAIEQLLSVLVQKSTSIEHLLATMAHGGAQPGLQLPMANRMVPTQGNLQAVSARVPNATAVNTANLANRQLKQAQMRPGQMRPGQTATINRAGRQPQISRARSFSLSAFSISDISEDYTQQMSPLAALPALAGGGQMSTLMPLLQQVLTPETVQMLVQTISPTKLIGAVSDAITQAAKVTLESKKADQSHLEKLMIEDETAEKNWLFAQSLAARPMVTALAGSPEAIDYKRVGRVRLAFADVTPLMLHGRSRVLYHQDRDIAFPLTIETPRPISKGKLQLLVKDPETLEIFLEDTYWVEDVDSGPLDVMPELSRDQLELLESNEDYLVTVALIWKGRDRKTKRKMRLGTSMTQLITLVRDYCFDRIEGAAETVALNDVDRYRAYWHKVWQGAISAKRRRLTLDCKYYYALEKDRTTLARMETVTRIEQTSDTRQAGRLKAGMMLNPERLNDLLDDISDHPPLEEEELAALVNSDNVDLFHALARTEVQFKGRRGSTVALWIYPEFKLQRILLRRATEINDHGHVTELEEHPVHFPMPAQAHFIGVSDDD